MELSHLGASKSNLEVNHFNMIQSSIQLNLAQEQHSFEPNHHKSEPAGVRHEIRFDIGCNDNGVHHVSDIKELMEEFHSQTKTLHSHIWNEEFVEYFYRISFFVNQALKCIGSCWLYGYFQFKGGHLLQSDIVAPFSVIAASMSIMDQYCYFVGGSVGPHDHRGTWLGNTTISSNLFSETHIYGRPFANMPYWCTGLDSESLGGQFKIYEGMPAMDFSLVSNIFLQSCSALHKNDFYNMSLPWLDHGQKKGNKHNLQLSLLKGKYDNFIVPNHNHYTLEYNEFTTILNPPTVIQKINKAPFDHYSQFIARLPGQAMPLSHQDWIEFALKCLELIAAPTIHYYSGGKSSKGGKPFPSFQIVRFKNTLSAFSNHMHPWAAVFCQSFWAQASVRSVFHSQKDFIDIISRVALSTEQCPTSFPGWADSAVRTFTFQARNKFPASPDCEQWQAALTEIKSMFHDSDQSLVILHIHSTEQRMFEKAFRLWNLI